MPKEINPTDYESIAALLEESFRVNRAKPAFACTGKEITYGELDTLSCRLAAWFQSRGLVRGARVAMRDVDDPLYERDMKLRCPKWSSKLSSIGEVT